MYRVHLSHIFRTVRPPQVYELSVSQMDLSNWM